MPLIAKTTANLNLRVAPGGAVLTVVPVGASVEVNGLDGTWAQGRYGSTTGVMSRDYLTPQSGGFRVVVTADLLNLRSGPSGSATVLAQLPKGTLLDASAWQADRLAVKTPSGGSGWVSSGFVAPAPAASTPTVAPAHPANAADVRARRATIAAMSDAAARAAAYEALQLDNPYFSQRDNDAVENGARIEIEKGRMCNLTSLAMVLTSLGIDNPTPTSQYEDALEALRQAKKLPDRTWTTGWGGVAEAMGAEYTIIAWEKKTTKAWWNDTIRPHLRLGHGAMMSICDHIVRVAGVRDDGLVVDDPYGKSRLKAGEARTFTETNGWRDTTAVVGRGTVYPWADVEVHTMRWIAVFTLPSGQESPFSLPRAVLLFKDEGPSDPDAEEAPASQPSRASRD